MKKKTPSDKERDEILRLLEKAINTHFPNLEVQFFVKSVKKEDEPKQEKEP